MNEQDQFFADLENDQSGKVDILDAPLIPDEAPENGGTQTTEEGSDEGAHAGEDDDDESLVGGIKPRNRKERRRLERLVADRESAIFLQGKLAAREEGKKAVTEESDYLKAVENIYGVQTPEAQIATDLLKKAIVGARDDAKAQALAEMREERQRELEAESQASDELDEFIDEIEDTFKVRLTEAQEKSYFKLLNKMSRKDAQGRVTEYADPISVFEIFQERSKTTQATGTRAKVLSNRSMTQSGASKESSLKDDAATRFLKEQGII